jgi:hypothetical protein
MTRWPGVCKSPVTSCFRPRAPATISFATIATAERTLPRWSIRYVTGAQNRVLATIRATLAASLAGRFPDVARVATFFVE